MLRSRWSVEELQVVIAGLKERLDQRRFCHFLGLSPRTRSYYRSFEGGEPGRRGYDRRKALNQEERENEDRGISSGARALRLPK